MPNVKCAVLGCKSSTYKINKWRKEICREHNYSNNTPVTRDECQLCGRPFHLYCFPSELRNMEYRKKWIKALERPNCGDLAWIPRTSERVCSIHFLDGGPTLTNPLPTLKLGHDLLESTESITTAPPQSMEKKRKLENNGELKMEGKLIKEISSPERVHKKVCNLLTPCMIQPTPLFDQSYYADITEFKHRYSLTNKGDCKDCFIETLSDKISNVIEEDKT